MATFLSFSYGSNMLGARIRARVPSARALGIARLDAHALRWHKLGRDGSGKCDVVRHDRPGACVWGVVHEIALAEKPALDRAEGLGHGYDERSVVLAATSGPVEALLYVATRIDAAALPFDWYHALVLAGAREHRLPEGYVLALAAQRTQPDTDRARWRLHHSLISR